MEFVEALENCSVARPSVLTIGNYDGIHLGHQQILKHLCEVSSQQNATSAVLTFSNQPSEVLQPGIANSPICSFEEKKRLIEAQNIDLLIAVPFTKSFAEQTPEQFLTSLNKHLSFSHLILGYNARFGKDRMGDKQHIQQLADKLNFSVEYLPPYTLNDIPISSSLIRNELQKGNLKQVNNYLGRPYAISGKVIPGQGLGAKMGFHTANIALDHRCLPPFGVYTVNVQINHQTHQGIANLGTAPTAKTASPPLLEVHLFNYTGPNLIDQILQVTPTSFLRPEQTFPNIEALKQQIKQDIATAQNLP